MTLFAMKNGQGAAVRGVEVGKRAKICILYLPDIQREAKRQKFPGFIPRGYKPCIPRYIKGGRKYL